MFKNLSSCLLHVSTLVKYADILGENGKHIKALKTMHKANKIFQSNKEKLIEIHDRFYQVYAERYYDVGYYCEAIICYLEYGRICKKLNEPIPDIDQQNIKFIYLLCRYQHGDKGIEMVLYFQAFFNSSKTKDFFKNNPSLHVKTLLQYADVLIMNGKDGEALEKLYKANEIFQSNKGTPTMGHVQFYEELAKLYYDVDYYCEAMICYLEYAQMYKKLNKPIPDDIQQKIKHTYSLCLKQKEKTSPFKAE